jgi:hypothetical protein
LIKYVLKGVPIKTYSCQATISLHFVLPNKKLYRQTLNCSLIVLIILSTANVLAPSSPSL